MRVYALSIVIRQHISKTGETVQFSKQISSKIVGEIQQLQLVPRCSQKSN